MWPSSDAGDGVTRSVAGTPAAVAVDGGGGGIKPLALSGAGVRASLKIPDSPPVDIGTKPAVFAFVPVPVPPGPSGGLAKPMPVGVAIGVPSTTVPSPPGLGLDVTAPE